MSTSEEKTAVDLHAQRQGQKEIAKEGGMRGRGPELNLLWCLCGCPGWGYSRNQIPPRPPEPKVDASAILLPRWSCLDMFRIYLPCSHMLI